MKKFLYAVLMWIMRLTWGLLDTLVGLIVFLGYAVWRVQKIGIVGNTIVVEVKRKSGETGWGLAGGIFIFSNTDAIWDRNYFFCHEWGHCWPQTLLFGPLHPFVVILPSVIRFWWRQLQYRKNNYDLPDYDSIWFEGTATRWGVKWFEWSLEHELLS